MGNELYYDLTRHSSYFKDLIENNYLQLDKYRGKYSPVTPFLIFLVTFPLSGFNIHYFIMTCIGFSIILTIGNIGNYLFLRQYFQGKYSFFMALLVLLNPFDILGLIPWAGISMAITTSSISWILFLQRRKMNNMYVKYLLISICMLISSFAHRTGFVIHFTAFVLVLIINYRNYLRSKKYLPWIIAMMALFIVIFLNRMKYITYVYLQQVLSLSGNKLEYLKSIDLEVIVTISVILMLYIGFIWRYNIFQEISFNSIEISYSIVSVVLFLLPIELVFISSRFLLSIQSVILLLFSLPLVILDRENIKEYKALLSILYFLIIIVMGIISIKMSIDLILSKMHDLNP
ncbi:MAG: hypothetical protein INQ03_24425 [Candidatus Heimdallarchaeota archaeon]|nr:hypothetical protein [Candidatus Heimdallarchaeota archaeon]